jgi:hypothetical protein
VSGQDLYERYVMAMEREGVEVDRWHELPDTDRRAWERVARELRTGQP